MTKSSRQIRDELSSLKASTLRPLRNTTTIDKWTAKVSVINSCDIFVLTEVVFASAKLTLSSSHFSSYGIPMGFPRESK